MFFYVSRIRMGIGPGEGVLECGEGSPLWYSRFAMKREKASNAGGVGVKNKIPKRQCLAALQNSPGKFSKAF
jgi:hypothetical protein